MSRGIIERMATARADAILEACIAADRPDLATSFIDSDKTVDEVKAELASVGDKGKPPAAPKSAQFMPWEDVIRAVCGSVAGEAPKPGKEAADGNHGWDDVIEKNNALYGIKSK